MADTRVPGFGYCHIYSPVFTERIKTIGREVIPPFLDFLGKPWEF